MYAIMCLMKTPGYGDAVSSGLIEFIKINPDWDKSAQPAEARAVRSMRSDRSGSLGRSSFLKPEGPVESQVSFRSPQTSR